MRANAAGAPSEAESLIGAVHVIPLGDSRSPRSLRNQRVSRASAAADLCTRSRVLGWSVAIRMARSGLRLILVDW